MITGHFGIAGMARSLSRAKTSSGLLVAFALASIAPDVVDIAYFVLGICSPYGLYSHTLHAVVLQAAIIAGAGYLATGSPGTAFGLGLVVLLHLPADLITGHKLLAPGGEMVGLYVYERPFLDYLVEVPIAMLGWWAMRRRATAPRWAMSIWMLALVVGIQTAFDGTSAVTRKGVKPSACFPRSAMRTLPRLAARP